MTTLPTDSRPISLTPELESAVKELLEPYKGDKLAVAKAAVADVYRSGVSGSFDDIVAAYRDAVKEALA